MVHDLFHQVVYQDGEFTIWVDYTEKFPQYRVYDSRTGVLAGLTNASYYMGACRRIMKDYRNYKKRMQYDDA